PEHAYRTSQDAHESAAGCSDCTTDENTLNHVLSNVLLEALGEAGPEVVLVGIGGERLDDRVPSKVETIEVDCSFSQSLSYRVIRTHQLCGADPDCRSEHVGLLEAHCRGCRGSGGQPVD